MNKLTPLVKGLITGLFMLLLTLLFYYGRFVSINVQYFVIYTVYATGILWTLITYSKTPEYTGTFGELFGQGFRCFIIVILIMVAFTWIFSAIHPEFVKTDTAIYERYLKETKIKDKTPGEIMEMVESYKKHYTTSLIYTAILGYLISGAIFTAVGAGLLLMRRK